MEVASEKSGFSELQFYLPVVAAEPVAADVSPGAILIIDDEPMMTRALERILKRKGYKTVLQAQDGKSALELMRNPANNVIMVICDYQMPEMDGIDVLRAIRQEFGELPFALATGSVLEEKISGDIDGDPNALFLNKPFDVDVLMSSLEQLNALQSDLEEDEP